jgi:hypothetical protein
MDSTGDLEKIITAALARAPAWLKQGLVSKHDKARQEAEECLAAMIAAAVASSNDN